MKPILIIDPGHGGKDPGGGSSIFYDPSGFYERDMVLQISLYQFDRFKQLGLPVTLTRDKDTYLSSTERTKIVRNSGAKYCISNHINAAGNSTARGVETIHSIYSDGKLAKLIFDAIVDTGMPGRRVFCRSIDGKPQTDYYFMHRETGAVSTVIVEYGFATNKADAELLESNWREYAEAAVRAFCQHVGHAYQLPEETKPEPEQPRVEARMSEEDADKIIRYLSAGWYTTEDPEARDEFKRLANEVRKAAGMPLQ